jgi:hypothetical protein
MLISSSIRDGGSHARSPKALAVLTLFLAAGAGAQTPSLAPAVTVVMTSYRYDPGSIVLKAGQPVRLLFENKAGKRHDFYARDRPSSDPSHSAPPGSRHSSARSNADVEGQTDRAFRHDC